MKIALLVLTFGLLTAGASLADDACLRDLTTDDLRGEYNIIMGPGTLTIHTPKGHQRVHPFPVTSGTGTIALLDGVPIFYSDDIIPDGGEMEISLRIASNAEKDLSFMDDPSISLISADDLANGVGCIRDIGLPMLVGTGTVTGDGNVVTNSTQLVVFFNTDEAISAGGLYTSEVFSEATGGTLKFHVRIQLNGTEIFCSNNPNC